MNAGVVPRATGEPAAILVPRREIETWVTLTPSGTPVDEAFARHARSKTSPAGAPPSLAQGVTEFQAVI